jgi:DNA repair exonuclease SbcCD ATPase subunit
MEALKAKYEKDVEDLKKEHKEKLAKANEDHAAVLEKVQEDISAKDEQITVLTKDKETAGSELDALKKEKENWEAEISSLEESMGAQYDVGFSYALDQVKVLFLDIDQARLGVVDALMKIVDGKLVPYAPQEG